MSKYIVKALANGTSIKIPANGRNPQRALDRVMRMRKLPGIKHCDTFICFDRLTGFLLATATRTV